MPELSNWGCERESPKVVTLDSRKLDMDQTPAHPPLDCQCHLHFSMRRNAIMAKCALIEAKLDQAAIEEQTRQDDQSWYMLFFRAKCARELEAENTNSNKDTVRPPKMAAGV